MSGFNQNNRISITYFRNTPIIVDPSDPTTIPKFVDPLPIPDIAEPIKPSSCDDAIYYVM